MILMDQSIIGKLANWGETLIASRAPDFVIGPADDPKVHRWFVIPRNPFANVYIHKFFRSDPEVPHDHPWDNRTIVLRGEYDETIVYNERCITTRRVAGDIVERYASKAHRIILPPEAPPTITLFLTGPIIRDWGFHCPQGWVHWKDFVELRPGGNEPGRGCGERD